MARYDQASANLLGEGSGFIPVQIASHATLGRAAVDRQQGQVDFPSPKRLGHSFEQDRVAAVINRPRAEFDDITQEFAAAKRVRLDGFVSRWNASESELRHGCSPTGIQANRRILRKAQPFRDELAIGLWCDESEISIEPENGLKGFRIQMVGVIVAGGDHVDRIETLGPNDAFRHSNMRLVGLGVLLGQRESSFRTLFTPATMLLSFCLAAHRAV